MATTNNEVKFAYFANKSDFTAAYQTSLANNIVFIADTKEVFTHGVFVGCQDLNLAYDSSTTKIQLKQGSTVLNELSAAPFIKDGMLDSVTYYTTAEQGIETQVPYVKFTFNIDSGKSDIRVSLADLANYNGANISLSSSYVMAQSYTAPAVSDSLDTAVGKLAKGVADANTNITALQNQLKWDEY